MEATTRGGARHLTRTDATVFDQAGSDLGAAAGCVRAPRDRVSPPRGQPGRVWAPGLRCAVWPERKCPEKAASTAANAIPMCE